MYKSNEVILEQMLDVIERILEYSKDFDNSESFVADYKTFDATLMNFIALGELAGKISDDFRDSHSDIEWRKIYAFRNIIAHDYFGIDEEEVFGIIQKHIPKFKEQLQKID